MAENPANVNTLRAALDELVAAGELEEIKTSDGRAAWRITTPGACAFWLGGVRVDLTIVPPADPASQARAATAWRDVMRRERRL